MAGLFGGNSLIIAGLLFDIVGVVVLAVPDLPTAARKFRFGRLRDARKSLGYGGLSEGDIGFEDLVQLHNTVQQPNIEVSPEDLNRIEYGPTKEPIFDEGDFVDWKFDLRVSFVYADDFEAAGLNIQDFRTLPEHLYPDILRTIERGERRFRLLGVSLIGLGFVLQLVSAVAS